MVLCEMHHARQSPCPVLIKSLQKSAFIGQISQYFPAREVCDWSVLTKLSLRMGLVPILNSQFLTPKDMSKTQYVIPLYLSYKKCLLNFWANNLIIFKTSLCMGPEPIVGVAPKILNNMV